MRAVLGVGEGKVWADMSKGGQVWMGHTDQAEIADMASGWMWVCVQV